MTPTIVAEISKNWRRDEGTERWVGHPYNPKLLCQLFEEVIETNRGRGYRLASWQLVRTSPTQDEINETIIAVFERSLL